MGRHIIGPFIGMDVIGGVFGHHLIEVAFKILTHGGVGVFIQGERGGAVLDEDMSQPDAVICQFRDLSHNFTGDKMKSPLFRGEGNLFLCPSHDHIVCQLDWFGNGRG